MLLDAPTAGRLVDEAVLAVSSAPDSFCEVLDRLPAPIYVTDSEGTITYFNDACVELAGRTPECGRDKYCVTWKIFTTDGEFLPHDQCPMAVAIREKRAIRNVEAVAQRPDGTTVNSRPSRRHIMTPRAIWPARSICCSTSAATVAPTICASKRRNAAAWPGRSPTSLAAETLSLMAAKYDAQALKLTRPAN